PKSAETSEVAVGNGDLAVALAFFGKDLQPHLNRQNGSQVPELRPVAHHLEVAFLEQHHRRRVRLARHGREAALLVGDGREVRRLRPGSPRGRQERQDQSEPDQSANGGPAARSAHRFSPTRRTASEWLRSPWRY